MQEIRKQGFVALAISLFFGVSYLILKMFSFELERPKCLFSNVMCET